MNNLKKLPIGIQSLQKIRDENCLLVDKTRLIKQLSEGGDYYFLSRPRRFGKSLFVDTLPRSAGVDFFKDLPRDAGSPAEH